MSHAVEALFQHSRTGGSTFGPDGRNLAGSNRWTAGLMPESARVSEHTFTPQEYDDFRAQHADLLSRHSNAAIGTSYDPSTGLHTMEVVGTTPVKSGAMKAAQSLGERSIFHLGTMQSEPTGESEHTFSPYSPDERFQNLRQGEPEKKPFSGTHFADKPLDVIDGNRRGQSGIGAESARLRLGSRTKMGPDAPPGFYVYSSGSLPESAIVGRKAAIPVTGHFAIAATSDPNFLAGYDSGVSEAKARGADDATAHSLGLNSAEHALKDAGFDGYSNPSSPHIHFLFGSHEVNRAPNR